MNVSRRWLEGFLRRPLEVPELVERLAMLGAPVDAVEPVGAALRDVVVGLVQEVRPHPNADRLRCCRVDDGSGQLHDVVCGAPNVTAGHRYPFARVGVTLPGGITLERRKIRGEVSEGMLCSARELGLGQDADGILELDTSAPPGTALTAILDADDDRLVVDVTPNRPDLLCHKGVARELAAAYGVPLRLPPIPGTPDDAPGTPRREGAEGSTDGLRVAIEDTETCHRFHACVLRGVRVGPSPDWLRQRLEAVGQRSINNVVDATNWVMLELNRPMHAYDLARVRGQALVVRRAQAGESLVTLDGEARTLDADMTVVADAEGAAGIGGVMGGHHSEVSDATTDVVLECAWWLPRRIRATRRALGLPTEASHRFERGVDPMSGAEAMRRCIAIIQATGGGELRDEVIDLWPRQVHPPRIFLRPDRVEQVLGESIPWNRIEQHLVALGCTVVAKPDDGRMAVDVPGWRPDLQAEIDLVEEVARLHGYDRVPSDLRPFRVGSLPDDPGERHEGALRQRLASLGLFEVRLLSLVPPGTGRVPLLNPLSADHAALRSDLMPGLVGAAERNWNAHRRDVRLFEIGTAFLPGTADRPREERRVAGVISGAREPAHWTASGKAPDADIWDLRGLFEAAVGLAHPEARVQVATDSRDGWVALGPDGSPVGWAAPVAADAPPWAAPLLGFELSVGSGLARPERYHAPPDTPAVERDLALVLPDGVSAERILGLVREAAGGMLEDAGVVDEYRGGAVGPGARSVAFRLRFRVPNKTLRDSDVDAAVKRIMKALSKDEPGVSLRTS